MPGSQPPSRLCRHQPRRRAAGSLPRRPRRAGDPTNVDEEPSTNLQPDLAVVRLAEIDAPTTTSRPLLVVEVLSPSTREVDRVVKRAAYARMGIASYWLLDPDEGALTMLALTDGSHAQTAVEEAGGSVTAQHPFAVRVSLADVLLTHR